jgi:hypothetical protein
MSRPDDQNWVGEVIWSVANARELEKEYRRRFDLRIKFSNQNIEFESDVFDELGDYRSNQLPWALSALFMLPIAWFFGARVGILSSMLSKRRMISTEI